MQTFKQWLLNEEIMHDIDAFGQVFMPTNAWDFVYASSDPVEHWWLKWKWAQERDVQRRPFFNIDVDEFEKRDYVSLQSEDMPAASGSGWKHRKDSKKNVTVQRHANLHQTKIRKHGGDKVEFLKPRGLIKVELPLDQMFGDKPSGKWPEQAEDKRWRKS